MTDDEWHKFLLGKLDEWLNWEGDRNDRPQVFKYLYMTPSEFIDWRTTGDIPKATKLCWVVLDDDVFNRIWRDSIA